MTAFGMTPAETVEALVRLGVPRNKAQKQHGAPRTTALPRKRPAKLTNPQDATTALFLAGLQASGLPRPIPEFRFARPRKWAFDFAFPEQKVAVEVEGGIWTRGRHTRGAGYLADMEKYNRANHLGWRLYRTTPDGLTTQATLDALRELLAP
jgi:hypothetical protein